MYVFLTLFVVLCILFVVVKTTHSDGFIGEVPLNTVSNPILPLNKVVAPSDLPVSRDMNYFNPLPSDLPGPLPIAPYEQIGSNLPSPYKVPSLVKTNRQRILTALETVKGFLAFQAQELDDRSDPSIQLPLQTARGDLKRLESEANVLQRNPGLTPQLTVLDIAQIEDNLAYLQREAELIGVNRPFQSKSHDVDLEGFTDVPKTTGTPATLDELNEFVSRIKKSILDLSSSGTSDPIVTARIGNLTKMKTDVETIIEKVNSKAILDANIPILQSDIQDALPILDDITKTLPDILQVAKGDTNSPSNTDLNTIAQFLTSYGPQLMENTSINFSIGYNPPLSFGLSTLTDTGFPSDLDLENVGSGSDVTGLISNNSLGNPTTSDAWAMDPRAEGRTPNITNTSAPFDWKGRVNDIIGQIKKRGMEPTDFGAMAPSTTPSADFSWKGYAKMICTRLMAAQPNRLDEMCGCPPSTWRGWK